MTVSEILKAAGLEVPEVGDWELLYKPASEAQWGEESQFTIAKADAALESLARALVEKEKERKKLEQVKKERDRWEWVAWHDAWWSESQPDGVLTKRSHDLDWLLARYEAEVKE